MPQNPELNISVTFRHTESTDALKTYAIDKTTHCLNKYLTKEGNVQVILLVEKHDHIAEVKVSSKDYDVTAKAATGDLYSSIDMVIDSLEAQLRKKKERLKENRHHQ